MLFLYNISITLYTWFVRIASPFNKKAKQWIEGRKNWQELYSKKIPLKKNHRVWFHCASLGEIEQARPVIEQIKENRPETEIILSFFSPSGYEERKNYALATAVIYLPADTASNAKILLDIIQPDITFFVKYEFWYHYIHQHRENKIPIYLLSGIFRPEQLFFQWYGGFYKSILKQFTTLFVQNTESQKLLESIGIMNSIISGDTRFDRCLKLSQTKSTLPLIESFIQNKFTIVAGSSWQAEENILHPIYPSNETQCLIIVPHDIQRAKDIQRTFSGSILYTEAEKNSSIITNSQILIVDKIGLLGIIYQYASVAFVGGGFSGQLHNILEAAAWGKPVIYGPKTYKFPEGDLLVEAGGGFKIYNQEGFLKLLNSWEQSPELLIKSGEASRLFISEQSGATKRVIVKLNI